MTFSELSPGIKAALVIAVVVGFCIAYGNQPQPDINGPPKAGDCTLSSAARADISGKAQRLYLTPYDHDKLVEHLVAAAESGCMERKWDIYNHTLHYNDLKERFSK